MMSGLIVLLMVLFYLQNLYVFKLARPLFILQLHLNLAKVDWTRKVYK